MDWFSIDPKRDVSHKKGPTQLEYLMHMRNYLRNLHSISMRSTDKRKAAQKDRVENAKSHLKTLHTCLH